MKRYIYAIAISLLAVALLKPAFGQTVHGIQWTWPAVTTDTAGNTVTVTGYNLYCGTSASGPFAAVNTTPIASPTFKHTGLTVGSTYFCEYSALIGTTEGGKSPVSAGVVFQFPPATPAQGPVGAIN